MQLKSSDTGFAVLGEEVLYNQTVAPEDPTIKNVVISENENNVSLRDKLFDVFSVVNDGDTVNFSIQQGVLIGGALAGQASLIFGEWTETVTVNLINSGTVAGLGGDGGNGGRIDSSGNLYNGIAGESGLTAIGFQTSSTPATFTITNNNIIGGGGGGGGGGGAAKGVISTGAASPSEINTGISGAGAGAGPFLRSGGGGGTIDNPSQFSASGSAGTLNGAVIGNNGQASSNTLNGSGGSSSERNFFSGFQPNPESTVRNGKGGNGGAFGISGSAGDNGYIDNVNSGGGTSNGGAGGSAGAAINKSGQSVTITNSGTIAGAVIT
jgi:hypothetical protein